MPKKPPIDKHAVLERIQYARDHTLLVKVRRWIPRSDLVEGFVVDIGQKWVALQRVSDQINFDGFHLLRIKDIQSVSIDPSEDGLQITALRARGTWPPTASAVQLDSAVAAIASAARSATLISIFDEFARPDVCWIGAPLSIENRKLGLLEVTTRGAWFRKPSSFDPADITRIDYGGGYEEALLLVAGAPPHD